MKKIIFLIAMFTYLGSDDVFANESFIKKSLTFHYKNYDKSQHSDQIATINWNTPEGIKRFERSKFKGDFFRLAHHFKYQVNPAACGQASGTIILSALYELNNKPFPLQEEWPITILGKAYPLEYRLINDNVFFNETTDKIINRKQIYMKKTDKNGSFGGGIDIDDLQKILKIHGVNSKLIKVSESSEKSLSNFRLILKSILNSDKKFLILNYDHSYKNLMGGHFSSPVAYDEESDSVMMLDVAAHKNPWIWVNLKDLYMSMYTKNYSQTSYRGYLVISSKLNK